MAKDFTPEEALAYLRSKGIKITDELRKMAAQEHAFAFTISGIAQRDILADVKASLEEAIEKGTPLAEWRKSLPAYLGGKGWQPTIEEPLLPPARLALIYDTNMRGAYAAGRWEKMQRSADDLPYLMYMLGPSRVHREDHFAWAGTVLPINHPWWDTHYPPNGFNCKCWVRQITAREAEKRGITTVPPAGEPDEGFDANQGKERFGNLLNILNEEDE